MREELHLFIIWENARVKEKEILEDISKKFEIMAQYEIKWSTKKFISNISRFYGTKLVNKEEKEQYIGNGPFLLVILKDKKPKYEMRKTNAGMRSVNINVFDAKTIYRGLTAGGHLVHGTESEIETNHDLTLLLGKNVEDFLKQHKKSNDMIKLEQDLLGTNGFESIEQLFYLLNNTSKYLILRNYEQMPEDIYMNEHNDIDILCENPVDFISLINGEKVFDQYYRVHYKTNVNNQDVYFDVRFLGDDYYCFSLEQELLKKRIWNKKGFYTIDKDNYFYTLLYHAYLHKSEFSDDYVNRLTKMNKSFKREKADEILEKWLIKNNYIITKPIDRSVLFNQDNRKNMLSSLYYENPNYEVFESIVEEFDDLNKRQEEILNSKGWGTIKFIRRVNDKLRRR